MPDPFHACAVVAIVALGAGLCARLLLGAFLESHDRNLAREKYRRWSRHDRFPDSDPYPRPRGRYPDDRRAA